MTQRYYSNIYWHFTGSPRNIDWRQVSCPNDIAKQGPILRDGEAVETLGKILEARHLRASCTEKVFDGLETEKFCCVTDIPFKDLPSHAPFYGRVAIGFRSSAVHRSFLPVLYVPRQSLPLMEKLIPNRTLTRMGYEAWSFPGSFQEQLGHRLLAQANANKEVVAVPDVDKVKGFFMNFVKITDFSNSPAQTFYREREWRNLGNFEFGLEDVAAIVVPEKYIADVDRMLTERGFPGNISVLAWEFIENA